MRKNFLSTAFLAVLTISLFFLPAASQAFFLTNETVGNKYTIEFLLKSLQYDGNDNQNITGQDLSATVIFTHNSFDSTAKTLSLGVDVTNTSPFIADEDGKSLNQVGLWALAFGMNPTASGVTLTNTGGASKFNSASLSIDPQLKNAVLDLFAGSQSSTGVGYPRTLNESMNDIFRLDFSFSDSISGGVSFSPFVSGWQTAKGSYQFGSVPEPSTMLLLGAGLIGIASLSRKKFKK